MFILSIFSLKYTATSVTDHFFLRNARITNIDERSPKNSGGDLPRYATEYSNLSSFLPI